MNGTACFCIVAVMAACGPDKPDPKTSAPGSCDGQDRPQLDCTSEFKYDGRMVQGGFSAAGLGGANAKTEEQALRQIDKETEQYAAQAHRLCDEYNKCVVDKDTYATRAENLRRRMSKAPELLDQVKSAPDERARRKALAAAYTTLVPDADRRELALDFAVMAQRPSESAPHAIGKGESLPTGSRVAFTVLPSQRAYVYLFQRGADGKINVLFPDTRIATANPISGALRIPAGATQSFKLNEKDVGNETVYIVAALDPIDSLGSAVGHDRAVAQVTDAADAPGCTRALELDEPPKCVRPRGLELDSEPSASFRARTEAADSVIVQAFSFAHTP